MVFSLFQLKKFSLSDFTKFKNIRSLPHPQYGSVSHFQKLPLKKDLVYMGEPCFPPKAIKKNMGMFSITNHKKPDNSIWVLRTRPISNAANLFMKLEPLISSWDLYTIYDDGESRLYSKASSRLIRNSLLVWLHSLYNAKTPEQRIPGSRWLRFELAFNWLFNTQYGFFIEIFLISNSKNASLKSLFAKDFLLYQNRRDFFFNSKYPILDRGAGTSGLFHVLFKKTPLLRLCRILLALYNEQFWASLSVSQKKIFLKQVLFLTIKEGTYAYINAMMHPLLMEKKTIEGCTVTQVSLYNNIIVIKSSIQF